MKLELLLVSCLLVTANAQCQAYGNFYFMEVSSVVTSLMSYMPISWMSIFPQMNQYTTQLYSMVSQISPSYPLASNLSAYICNGKQNYTYVYNNIAASINEVVITISANITLWQGDTLQLLKELDNVLRVAINLLRYRPECGTSDRQMLVQNSISPFYMVMQNLNGILQNMNSIFMTCGQTIISQIGTLIQYALMDQIDPFTALENVELAYLIPSVTFLKKQIYNSMVAMDYMITANNHVQLTELRKYVLNILTNITTWPCQYPDPIPCSF